MEKRFNNLKAVLFDFDGVLCDSCDDLFNAWKYALKDYIDLSRKEYLLLEGAGVEETLQFFIKKYNIKNIDKNSFKEIIKNKDSFFYDNYKFKLYSGVRQVLNFLIGKGVFLSLVSGSPFARLKKTVPRGFLNKFCSIVTADDIKDRKPSPRPYLTALDKLSCTCDECIVVENAPFGIQSAQKAGIFCVAIESTLDKEHLKRADLIVRNFDELSAFLFSIFKK